jgi:hypothetical protein
MQREVAEGILELMREYSDQLHQMVGLVKGAGSAEELEDFSAAVDEIMGYINADIRKPIFDEHPDLEARMGPVSSEVAAMAGFTESSDSG